MPWERSTLLSAIGSLLPLRAAVREDLLCWCSNRVEQDSFDDGLAWEGRSASHHGTTTVAAERALCKKLVFQDS